MTLTKINKAGLDELALDHVFTIGASGSSAYTFQGEGLNGTVNNPTLYLTRGKTYRFENGTGAHPIRIQSTSGASGTAYNTGVTNNAGSGTVIVEVQHDAPDVLYYQCTSHAAMNGILYITGALADGGVTTAKIADNAITGAKMGTGSVGTTQIVNGAITGAKMGNGSVGTNQIVDQAVTLAKLPHGTGSNDGKFLRANNGADPSFETVNTDLVADTSPQLGGDLASNGNDILMADNDKIKLGDSGDLEIFHQGFNSKIADVGTGGLILSGSTVKIENGASNETQAVFTENGAVELYYDNSKKFETTSGGAKVSGDLDVVGHAFPNANNTYDLGTTGNRWRNIYTNDLNLSNEGSSNDVDGTWGSYTIQEGAEDLFLVNKRNGKKYKFNLTEVS